MENFGDIFSNTWAFALVLLFFGGSIFVHEFGHFIAAKMRGLKVTRFSIGFGPRIFSWRGKDGCDYIISLLPLGGYVALPQLADMGALEGGNGEDESEKLPKASCADKIIVSAAGAFFNIIFAVLLATIIWCVGIKKIADYETNVVGFVPEFIFDISGEKIASPAKKAGIKIGDKILKIDSRETKTFAQIIELIAIGSGRTPDGEPLAKLEIERDGKILNIDVCPKLIKTNVSTGDEIRMIGVSPAMQMTVAGVMKNSPAEKAGIKSGDVVAELNGQKLFSNDQLGALLKTLPQNAKAKLGVIRDEKKIELEVSPKKVFLSKYRAVLSEKNGGEIEFFVSNKNDAKSKIGMLKVLSSSASPIEFSKMSSGDILCDVNGENVDSLESFAKIVNKAVPSSRLRFSMSGENSRIFDVLMPANLSVKIEQPESKTMLGYSIKPRTIIAHPSVWEQFSDSLERTYNALSSLVNPKSDVGIKSLAGPVDIGRVIYQLSLTDFMLVLSFAVLLNVNLAILNMLPIPVLDGGHILFATIEKLRGKPIPVSFFAICHGIFTILFLSLMVYVVYSGFMRWEGDNRLANEESTIKEFYIKDITF